MVNWSNPRTVSLAQNIVPLWLKICPPLLRNSLYVTHYPKNILIAEEAAKTPFLEDLKRRSNKNGLGFKTTDWLSTLVLRISFTQSSCIKSGRNWLEKSSHHSIRPSTVSNVACSSSSGSFPAPLIPFLLECKACVPPTEPWTFPNGQEHQKCIQTERITEELKMHHLDQVSSYTSRIWGEVGLWMSYAEFPVLLFKPQEDSCNSISISINKDAGLVLASREDTES